ncbi:MAG TPA: hypothetical protein VFA94_01750 [Acidimicrobiales bacterium]|nr:hypothetical protein [Acidimicrobiales bacterium]
MIGPILVVFALVVAIPVGLMLSGAVASVILSWFLVEDAGERYAGTEWMGLYR